MSIHELPFSQIKVYPTLLQTDVTKFFYIHGVNKNLWKAKQQYFVFGWTFPQNKYSPYRKMFLFWTVKQEWKLNLNKSKLKGYHFYRPFKVHSSTKELHTCILDNFTFCCECWCQNRFNNLSCWISASKLIDLKVSNLRTSH